jgi:capsular polysaccharide transport system permease protein
MAHEVTTPQSAEPTERELARKARKSKRNRNIIRAILVPTLLSLLYYLLIAPATYHSNFEFMIEGTEKVAPDLLSGIGIPAVSGASNDAHVVRDYIRSAEMVALLRDKWRFREAYSRPSVDPLSRLAAGAPIEEAVDFWHDKAKIDYIPTGNTISVSVGAYTAEDAKLLAQGVLDGARLIVDQLDKRVSTAAQEVAAKQLAEQKLQFEEVRKRVTNIRGSDTMTLDAQSTQAVQTISQIDSEIARLRVEQATTRSIYQPSAPQSRAVDAKIVALESARNAAIKRAQQGLGKGVAESDVAARTAVLDYEFAQKSYYAALQAYQSAASSVEGKQRHIVAFIPPRLPERSDYWLRLWNVLAIMVVSAILAGVGMLTYSVIKDHSQ